MFFLTLLCTAATEEPCVVLEEHGEDAPFHGIGPARWGDRHEPFPKRKTSVNHIPDATHGTAIGLPIRPGVVPGASMGRHIFQSHGSCMGIEPKRSVHACVGVCLCGIPSFIVVFRGIYV